MNKEQLIQEAAKRTVVCLAMQTHGAEEDYQCVGEIAKCLIEKHGFTHVFFLSSWFDSICAKKYCADLNDIQAISKQFLYKANAKSQQFFELMKFIEHHNEISNRVHLHGIDIPMGGQYSIENFMTEIESYLSGEERPVVVEQAWPGFLEAAQRILSLSNIAADGKLCSDFCLCLGFLKGLAEKYDAYFKLLVNNLHARYLSMSPEWSRETQITENYEHVIGSIPDGGKIMIIGHAIHLAPVKRTFGSYIKQKYRNDAYSILLTASTGQVLNTEFESSNMIHPFGLDDVEQFVFQQESSVFYNAEEVQALLAANNRRSLAVKVGNYQAKASIADLMLNQKVLDALICHPVVSPVKYMPLFSKERLLV